MTGKATLLTREILHTLIAAYSYSLKWLHIVSANMFHPKLPQPSLKELHQTVAGHSTYCLGQRQSHPIVQSSKSNMWSV